MQIKEEYAVDYANLPQLSETPSTLCFSNKTLMFVSDISEESDAAKAAKLQIYLMIRQGNQPVN